MRIVSTDYNKVVFDNNYQISCSHQPDCCEYNYADFQQLDDEAINYDYAENLLFEIVDGHGFRFGDKRRLFFVPCYSEQNGYYSSDIDIQYYNDKNEIISHFNVNCEWISI